MENGAIDYLSFVRGYIAATDLDTNAMPEEHDSAVDRDSFAAGYAVGSRPVEYVRDYRELSVAEHGRFSGTLDLSPPVLNGREYHDEPPPVLSGTLDLG